MNPTHYPTLASEVVNWIKNYLQTSGLSSLVIGVSGGIDSAVTSTLAAQTSLPTYVLNMPIHQDKNQYALATAHCQWLVEKFSNVEAIKMDLTDCFESFKKTLGPWGRNVHGLANARSRLRMMCLYQIAAERKGIVVGTGNKIEDYGVGFYTKYGDGGVDIAPIADLYKSEVWELGKLFEIDPRIITADPTDGLWDDGRTDEDQIGTSYAMLEWVMEKGLEQEASQPQNLNDAEKKALEKYKKFHSQNRHKMEPIPTFKRPR